MLGLNRKGYTLIELLIGVVLLTVVSAATYRVLVNNQRIYHSQVQRIDLQQNIRAAETILPAEFRELSASEGDIQAMSPTSITIRALRQLGIVCQLPALGGLVTNQTLLIHRRLFYGSPLDPLTDSLLVYYEGDPLSRNDDSWVRTRLVNAATAGTCPDGFNSPAYTLTVDYGLPVGTMLLNRAGAVPNGAPLRGFQTLTYSLYQAADGEWYLGLQPRGAALPQPLIGPLSGSNGLTLRYFNAANAITAVRDSVAAIEVTVRGRTAKRMHIEGQGGGLQYMVDSVTTRVALRNNRRFN